jgi:hypothetical protein
LGRDQCDHYVSWFNGQTKRWATWEPGDLVAPGDVGKFAPDKDFVHYQSLEGDFGIEVDLSEETPTADRFYASKKGFNFAPAVEAEFPDPVSGVVNLGASVKVTATRENAALLQVLDPTTQHVLNVSEVLMGISGLLLRGRWEVDLVVVLERVRVGSGFAAISTGAHQSLELRGAAGIQIPAVSEIGGALRLAGGWSSSGFARYEFQEGQTPIFGLAVRVKQSLWTRLIPALRNKYLDVGGTDWRVDQRPWNLEHVPSELRRYDMRATEIPIPDVMAMALGDLFEVVEVLDHELSGPEPGAQMASAPRLRADAAIRLRETEALVASLEEAGDDKYPLEYEVGDYRQEPGPTVTA